MKNVILLLDFLFPLFFFLLGRSLRGEKKKKIMRASSLIFCVSLLFGPVLYRLASFSVQIVFCAVILFLQCAAICRIDYEREDS